MSFLRHRQRAITSVGDRTPHKGWLIPARRLAVSRPELGLHVNMWRDDGPRLPSGRGIMEDNGFSGLRLPEGTIGNYYQASVGDGFWGYNPINDVDPAHQTRIIDHNNTITGGLTFTPRDMQDFLRAGDVVSYALNIVDDQQAQGAVAALWTKPIALVELGNELYATSVYGTLIPDFSSYKVLATEAQGRWSAVHPDAVWGAVISKDTYDKEGSPAIKDWDTAVEADNGWFDKYIIHIYTRPDNNVDSTPENQYLFAINYFDTNWPDVPVRWADKGIWITEWGVIVRNAGNPELDAFYQSEYAEYWAANVLMTFLGEPLVEFAAVHSWQVFVRSPQTPLYNAYRKLSNIPGEVTTIVNDASEHIITIGNMTATLKKQSPYSFTVTPT